MRWCMRAVTKYERRAPRGLGQALRTLNSCRLGERTERRCHNLQSNVTTSSRGIPYPDRGANASPDKGVALSKAPRTRCAPCKPQEGPGEPTTVRLRVSGRETRESEQHPLRTRCFPINEDAAPVGPETDKKRLSGEMNAPQVVGNLAPAARPREPAHMTRMPTREMDI